MQEKKKLDAMMADAEMSTRLADHLRSKRRLLSKESPFSELLQGMVNVMLEGELDTFIDEEKASGRKNKRNGGKSKQLTNEFGPLQVYTPRERNGAFEPEILAKRERELSSGLEEQILALYAGKDPGGIATRQNTSSPWTISVNGINFNITQGATSFVEGDIFTFSVYSNKNKSNKIDIGQTDLTFTP